jgi:hypothetical protein
MGLDASVMCLCFAEGKAKPLPFHGQIKVGEQGLELEEPFKGNEKKHELFYEWLETACPHFNMDIASEVFSWPGMFCFRQTLEFIGGQHFPTLLRALPAGMTPGSPTTVFETNKMLDELKFFSKNASLGWSTVLMNTETGKEMAEFIAAYKGIFVWTEKQMEIGIDDDGFFVRRTDSGDSVLHQVYSAPDRPQITGRNSDSILFRSVGFEQIILERNEHQVPTLVEFVDVTSGTRFRSTVALSENVPQSEDRMLDDKGRHRREYPCRMHATTRAQVVADFDYVVIPLQKLCKASIETGNPIRWA